MFYSTKQTIAKYLFNLPGWHTTRKIVVIESDDWGSIRMASKHSFNSLLSSGIRVDSSKYNTFDSLEKKEDLSALFEILKKHKNHNRVNPKFTFNTVMGNPDFELIKKNNFEKFYHEHFNVSYESYYGENLKELWNEGIENQLIVPQFHAREHLNSELWMNDLRAKKKETIIAFNHNFFGLKTKTSSSFQKNYLAAYYAETRQQLKQINKIIASGLQMFEDTFQFRPSSFIGCNYVWPKEMEPYLKDQGINYLQGQRGHISPVIDKQRRKVYYHYTGQKTKSGQFYLVRNVLFEPFEDQNKDWVDIAMKEIKNAFFWKKPAIISTHRVNYASNMNVENRDASLKKLDNLLKRIIKKWPDVEFLSSNELGHILSP